MPGKERKKTSSRSRRVPESVKCMLWGRAAGRCQLAGCNDPVHLHRRTRQTVNLADLAHIIGFSKDGPRGESKLSERVAADINNLMLLCRSCHKLIDDRKTRGQYPVSLLKQWKTAHEDRVKIATGISPNKESTILLYGANIGQQDSVLTYAEAGDAMFPDWYPATETPFSLGVENSHMKDDDQSFWTFERAQLETMFQTRIRPGLANRSIRHLSVFGFAPQPLLMLLGSLLTEIPSTQLYQLHRQPRGWKWKPPAQRPSLTVDRPGRTSGQPALVFSISGNVTDDRITSVLSGNVDIWRVGLTQPDREWLRSIDQLHDFGRGMRGLMDEIKAKHGQGSLLHVFPAMPVAAAIEFGRVLMPKADLPVRVYDQNHKLGGFVHALDLNPIQGNGRPGGTRS